MTPNERLAMEELGWTKDHWLGKLPPPTAATKNWSELSASQQAAVKHGLQLSEENWNSNTSAVLANVNTQQTTKELPKKSLSASVMKTAWSGIKFIAPLVSATAGTHPVVKFAAMAIEKAPTWVVSCACVCLKCF